MPWSLHRYQQTGDLHFITFSCYRRRQLLDAPARNLFEHALERARRHYGFWISAYVVMPENVHLLLSEPDRDLLSTAIKAVKLSVARHYGGRYWQERYYDFNVWSHKKHVERIHYIHFNPVRRGMVERAQDWPWSSFRHHADGTRGVVEIESIWTARERERLGIVPQVKVRGTTPGKPTAGLPGPPSHQFLKELYGMDDGTMGTYNVGNCSDPANYTGKKTNGTNIDWERQTFDALRKALDTGILQ